MMTELLILIVIVVTLSLAVYHIAQFSTRETPFEEALAEQRQKSISIVSLKTEKNLKKAKLKRVKPRKDEVSETSVKTNLAPVHHPSNNQSKANIPPQSLIQKEKSVSEPLVQKAEHNVDLNQSVTQPLSSECANAKDSHKSSLEKEKKKSVKIEEKEEKQISKEESKSNNLENSNEKENKKVKDDKKEMASKDKKGNKAKETSKKEVKKGKDKIIQEEKEEENKKEVPEEKVKEEESVQFDEEAEDENMDVQDLPKKSSKAKLGSVGSSSAEQVNTKKMDSSVSKKLINGGMVLQPTSSPKKASHTSKEIKQKKQENFEIMEKVMIVDLLPEPQEHFVKIQPNETTLNNEFPHQNDCKKRKDQNGSADWERISISDDVVSRIMPIIQRAQLSGGEVETLIEALLNKQQLSGDAGGGEWVAKRRVDPEMQLRRQLEEAESRLREQVEAHETLSAKIVDLRSDLNSERGRSNILKKQLETNASVWQQRLDAAAALNKEHTATKLADLRASLDQEYQSKLIQQQQIASTEHEEKLKELSFSLSEANAQLQKASGLQHQSEAQCQQVQTALAEVQQKFQATSQERDELVETCQQYQQHLASVKEQDASLNSRLYEAQQKVTAAESAHSQVMMQLTQIVQEKDILQQQLSSKEGLCDLLTQTQAKLNNTTLEKNDLEDRLLHLERIKTDLENRLHQVEGDKSEIESRLHQNDKDKKELEVQFSHLEKEAIGSRKLLANQQLEIDCLKEEKESLASQSVRPAAEGRENGDIHNDRHSQQNFEYFSEEQFDSLSREIARLKEESLYLQRQSEEEKLELQNSTKLVLLKIFPSLKSMEHLNHKAFLQEVENASVAVKTQSATPVVEKVVPDPALSQKLDQLQKENGDLCNKVKEIETEKLRLEGLVKDLMNEKASLKNSIKSSLNEQIDRQSLTTKLELENKGLVAKIANYEDILANTESLLKTLQKSVENEESTWHEKLLQKEELVSQLTVDKNNLLTQVSDLQSSLDKVKHAEEIQSQLDCLKEKLIKVEKAKESIQLKLDEAQEQLKANGSLQIRTNGPATEVDSCENEVSQAEKVADLSAKGQAAPGDAVCKKKKRKKAAISAASD